MFKTLVAVFLLASAGSVFAQNTKGDRPIPNQKQVRETKFKSVKKRKKGRTRDISGRRLRTKNKSSANRANASWPRPDAYPNRNLTRPERPAKPLGKIFNKPPREKKNRAWKGNISGHKLRVKSDRSDRARTNVYPQHGPFVNNPSKKPRTKHHVYTRTASGKLPVRRIPDIRNKAWKGDIKGGRVGTPSRTAQFHKIYPQKGRFVNHQSKEHRFVQRNYRNNWKIARAARREKSGPPGKRWSVSAFSISKPFVTRGRKNVYWGKFSKGEKPYTRDITGRKLRTRNFKSTPAGLVSRDTLQFFGRKPGGDRASSAGARGRNFSSRRTENIGAFLKGGGFKSRSGRAGNRPLPARPPGIGATGLAKYLNKITGRKPIKGGGSASGKRWNNNGNPIPVRTGGAGAAKAARFQGNFLTTELSPGFTRQGAGYSGNIKARKPAKGGGSVSGRRWNNNGNPIPPRIPEGGANVGSFQGNFRRGELSPGFTKQGADFSGNMKARKPLKGGGSVSGKLWNNNNNPIAVRTPAAGAARAGTFQGNFRRGELSPGFSKQGADFSGNIKARRPAKGGGSVSGKLWNNNNNPIAVRTPAAGAAKAGTFQGHFKRGELSPGFTRQGEDFAGNIKAKKPQKGGGSISGMWNNNETPIAVRAPGSGSAKADIFQGNIKFKRPAKGGGSVSGKLWNNNETPIAARAPGKGSADADIFQGHLKLKKIAKGGGGSISGKLWNNGQEAIAVRTPSSDARASDYSGRIKSSFFKRTFTQNPNAVKESVKKHKPNESIYEVAGLQVKVRRGDYQTRRSGAKGSLPGIAPRKNSVKASEFARGMKRTWDYKHNPKSADEALKVQTPGKATALAKNFQGNVKMHKYKSPDLHPDAQFAHGTDDNVKEERTIFTNIKLFWAKLFRRSSTQPDHLKDKVRKPRYDKGEKGLWYY